MRIGAIIDSPITSGGGFSQSVSAVLQLLRLAGSRHEARVYTTIAANVAPLRELGIEAIPVRFGAVDWFVSQCARQAGLRSLQARLKMVGRMEQALVRDGVDLVYFVGHTSKGLALQTLPMISTLWDACHLDMPEFPEVRDFNEFLMREEYLSAALPQSVAVVVDSRELADKVTRRYGLDRRRLVVMPFSPNAYLEDAQADPAPGARQDYLFYPAQFWAHKNHVRVVEAVRILRDRGVEQKVVFCGKDNGNLAYIQGLTRELGVADLVTFLGFVPGERLRQLYLESRAVVFASYFGPTNLPPLEAWKLERPLICARELAAHAGAAAMLFDTGSAGSLADAILQVRDERVAAELVARGRERLRELDAERAAAERELETCLDAIEQKLQCWKPAGSSPTSQSMKR